MDAAEAMLSMATCCKSSVIYVTEDSRNNSRDHGVQTDIDSVTFQQLVDDNIALHSENSRLAAKLNMHDLKIEAFEGNNECKTRFICIGPSVSKGIPKHTNDLFCA